MADQPRGFVRFGGNDPPLDRLPPAVRDCVTGECQRRAGADAARAAACDATMSAFCAQTDNAQTTYCACINAAVPGAACYFAPCTNSAFAYRLSGRPPLTGACPSVETVCVQVMDVRGSNSIVRNLTQSCGPQFSVNGVLASNKLLTLITFVLVVALVYLALVPARAPPPPPELVAPLVPAVLKPPAAAH